jgi:hypothetical protein
VGHFNITDRLCFSINPNQVNMNNEQSQTIKLYPRMLLLSTGYQMIKSIKQRTPTTTVNTHHLLLRRLDPTTLLKLTSTPWRHDCTLFLSLESYSFLEGISIKRRYLLKAYIAHNSSKSWQRETFNTLPHVWHIFGQTRV